MEIPTRQNHVYTLTCDNACDVYDVDTGTLIHQHHAGEVQSQFTAIGMKSETTDDTAILTELFNGATAGNGSGGGYIESNLNVGHGAADAVAAVCTLTLGDLGTGGTLTDSNGQSVELENPHKYATGTVSISDATAAGSITFGTHEAIVFDADLGAKASGSFFNYADAVEVNGVEVAPPADTTSVEGWNAAFETAGVGLVCTAAEHEGGPEYIVHVEAAEYGVQGNAISITNSFGAVVTLEGGKDPSRTPQEVVDALNANEDCPAEAVLSHVDEEDAKAVFTPWESYDSSMAYELAVMENGVEVNSWEWNAHDGDTVQELLAALNDDSGEIWHNTRDIEATLEDGKVVLRRLGVHGAASNGLEIHPWANTPFMETEETPIEGGSDESDTITLTAKEYGVNDTITITGGLFENAVGMSGGHGDYTVAELVTAIAGEFDDITPAAGEAEGTITLTANTAGKAANAVVYTSTGCFGGETVKQGSTTRGKDAVSKTSWQIVLNGEVLDVEPAPVPEPLGTTTTLKQGHVYLVTADATAQDFTGITLADNATAEIWLTCTSDDNSVALPGSTQGWIWLDAMPDMEAGKTYAVAARNVGNAVLARPIYDYTTPAQS